MTRPSGVSISTKRSQDVTGGPERGGDSGAEIERLIELRVSEEVEGLGDVAGHVERGLDVAHLARLLAGLPHRPIPVLLLELGSVVQDDLGDFSRGVDRDRSPKAAVHERQPPAVIEMTVGQEDGVDLGRIERKRLLVERCDVVPLERPQSTRILRPRASIRWQLPVTVSAAPALRSFTKRPVRGSARGPCAPFPR